ncbi:MAG TPA: glycosyltransferase, partial [Actinomycetota bacterium]|nr:glycosyltransferase [Actinomycetota bacterium]
MTRVVTRLNVGGPARQELALTGALRRAGISTELVTGRPDPGEGLALGAEAADTLIPSLRRPINPRRDLRAFVALSAHLRSRRPDVVHTHLAKAGGLGRLAAQA